MEGEELDLLEPELEEDDTVSGDICGEQVLADYKLQENNSIAQDPFRNIPTTPRPRSVSARTDISDKMQLNCPHPSKCTIATEERKTEIAGTIKVNQWKNFVADLFIIYRNAKSTSASSVPR